MSNYPSKGGLDRSVVQQQPYDGYYKYDQSVAQDYERDRQVEPHWWREDEFIHDHLAGREIRNLLDLPVGTGRFFRHYAGVKRLVGIDISEEMLNEARKKLSLMPQDTVVVLECGDVFNLPFGQSEFDVTIVWRLLHLLPQELLQPAIKELCRVSSAELVVQTYVPASGWKKTIGAVCSKILPRLRSPEPPQPVARTITNATHSAKPWSHIQAYFHKQSLIDSLFHDCGFSCVDSRMLGHYGAHAVRGTVYTVRIPRAE